MKLVEELRETEVFFLNRLIKSTLLLHLKRMSWLWLWLVVRMRWVLLYVEKFAYKFLQMTMIFSLSSILIQVYPPLYGEM